jgi:methylamine dehydrogenase accessory protein MauD
MSVLQAVVDVVLAGLVGGLFLVLFALLREVGRIQVRLGPLGARLVEAGPRTDDLAPVFEGLVDQAGREVSVGGRRARPQLVMFTSTTCTTCLGLMPGLSRMAELSDGFDLVVISDGDDAAHREFLARAAMSDKVSYLNTRHVGMAYQVTTTPYAVALAADGRLLGKGVCNRMRQVEELLSMLGVAVPDVSPLPILSA